MTQSARASGLPLKRPSLPALLAGLSVVALVSTALSLGALALALRSLESVWRDRVEALAFLHGVTAPLDRAVPAVAGHGVRGSGNGSGNGSGEAAVTRLAAARADAASSWQRYLTTTLTTEEAALVDRVTPTVTRALAAADSTVAALRSGDAARVTVALDSALLPALAASDVGLESLVALQGQITRQQVESARQRHQWARLLLIASGIITGALIIATLSVPTTGMRKRAWRR